MFWLQSPWSGPVCYMSSYYISDFQHQCPDAVFLWFGVWLGTYISGVNSTLGYFDAVLRGTLSSVSELSLKATSACDSVCSAFTPCLQVFKAIWRRKNMFIPQKFSSAAKWYIRIDFVSISRTLTVPWSLLWKPSRQQHWQVHLWKFLSEFLCFWKKNVC